MILMICGKMKIPSKVENVPNKSKNEIRNPQMNNNGSKRRVIDFQPMNQRTGVVKEILVYLLTHENHINIKQAQTKSPIKYYLINHMQTTIKL